MPLAGKHDFYCEQGSTWSRSFVISDSEGARDLTDFTGRMSVRRRTCEDTSLIDLTTENGRMTITPLTGTVGLTLTATETAALTDDGVYDIEIEDSDGVVERVLEGKFILGLEVTR